MPLFVRLVTTSDQGVRNIKQSAAQLAEARKVMEVNRVKLLHAWTTLGPYDAVSVLEAPDAATMAKVSALIAAQGNYRAITMAAVPFEEFTKLVS